MDEQASESPTRTACPPWCDQIQCTQTHPVDRQHQFGLSVPVITKVAWSDDGERILCAASDDANAVLYTSAVEDDELWVALSIDGATDDFTVTLESMMRVYRAIGEVLDAAGTRPD
jgi:hypothetical protein